MNVLVTGGAGFIGSHLTEELLARGWSVVCLDNFDPFYSPRIKRRNLQGCLANGKFTLVEGDIRDLGLLRDLFSKYRFEYVVHLAAKAGVRPSILDPLTYEDVNVKGTLGLLECVKDKGLKNFVFASSSSVYGNGNRVPFREDEKVDVPVSPYGATKKACETFCANYHALYSIPMVLLRFFTAYGPRQRPEMAVHKFTRLIDSGEEVPVYGDGTSKRDYTYIADIVQGIVRCIDLSPAFEIINLGCSRTIDLSFLIQVIEQNLKKKAKIKFYDPQPGDVEQTYADIQKAGGLLDYKPSVRLEDGVKSFVEWYLDVKEDLC